VLSRPWIWQQRGLCIPVVECLLFARLCGNRIEGKRSIEIELWLYKYKRYNSSFNSSFLQRFLRYLTVKIDKNWSTFGEAIVKIKVCYFLDVRTCVFCCMTIDQLSKTDVYHNFLEQFKWEFTKTLLLRNLVNTWVHDSL